ncbi:MAG: PhnD/SsuA/transferrin family substrate-binding protein, partial [Rhodocyclaceae bacterium]|nr:PhnD/SsuA/transferrin family substrate-binding protein [Rhodocyclaceae bacterium]
VLEARHHVTRIATLVRETGGRHVRQFGGVIFTRADRADLGAIGDIRGKRVAAVGPTAFGGFLMQAQVLREAGIDVSKDASMDFLGLPQDKIVQAVLDGRADAGFVRSDLLEQMAGEGRLNLDRLRVLNPRQVPDYPFLLSTPLYPEWPIAAADRTPLELSNRVAVALLSMPPGHPAAHQGGYYAWTVPLSYRSVHDLMRAMRVAPYDRPEDFHLADVVRKYDFHLLALLAAAGMVAAAVAWRFRRMNRALGVQIGLVGERTTALESEVARRRLAERHLERETHALEMMARNAGLPDVMHVLCLLCEDGSRGGHAIIMESAEDGHVLRLAAAPSLSADCRKRLAELVPPGDGPAAWREAVAAACGDALVPRLVVPIDLQGGRHGGVLVLLMPADAALADGADDAVRDAATLAGLALDGRRAAEQVRLSASVFDNALEGIVITDADSRIVQVNQAFVRATGFAPEEVIGRRPSLLRSGRHDRPFYAAMWDALVRDGSWRGEIWNKRRNGEIYPQILQISAIRDDQGRTSHYIGIYA